MRVLFLYCGPTAIAWKVAFVGLYPVERCARGSRPHIVEEIFKGAPAVTNRNAATTVQLKLRGFGIRRALNHHVPRRILGSVSPVAGMPVLYIRVTSAGAN